MIRRFIGVAAIVAAVAIPALAQAQGVPGGVERGAREGERAAGPVGAIVGGTIGGVVGGVAGVLGVEQRPRFHSYVVEQRRPSYQYREDVRVGAVLPEEGVTYYDCAAGNTACATIATPSSTAAPCWSNRARTGLSRSSSNPAG